MSRDDEQPCGRTLREALSAPRRGPSGPASRSTFGSRRWTWRPRSRTSAASRRPACSRPTKPPRWRTRSARCAAIADVFDAHPSDEDVHSAIERGVTERLGDLGRGSTRDAVATIWSSPTCGCGSSRRPADRRAHRVPRSRAGRPRPPARSNGHARDDPRAFGPARDARTPPPGARVGARARSGAARSMARQDVGVAPGRGRARDDDPAPSPGRDRAAAGFRPRVLQLHRCGVGSRFRPRVLRRRGHPRHAPVTARRRSRAVDGREHRLGAAG